MQYTIPLEDVVRKSERYIQRKVRTLVLSGEEFERLTADGRLKPRMKLWEKVDLAKSPAPSNKRAPVEVG